MDRGEERLQIRRAKTSDIPELVALIELSVRVLQAPDYSADQIEGALGTVFGVDSRLIVDGTYLVVETAGDLESKFIVGCGGWSGRKTLFGGDRGSGREDIPLDPLTDNARIRAFFVHPVWARRGIGSMILRACETAAMEAGFRGFELGATITGEHLYRAKGYREIERVNVPLVNGASLPIIRMSKQAS